MRAIRISLLVTLVLIASLIVTVGCRQGVDSLQNATTLQRIGFRPLGSGFYFKPGVFLVQLDAQDRVSSIITSRDSFGYKNHKSDRLYKAVAIAPEASPSGGTELRLVDENGSCIEVPVSGNGQGPCEDPALFTPEESASGTPLKTRLAKIARTAAPSVYTIADTGDSHQDFYTVYRNESLIFVGNTQPGSLSAKTRILDYHERKEERLDTEFGTLELQGEYIRYELASNGYIVSGSAKQLRETSPELTPEQRFRETEPSGFHIGGSNGNEVIDHMSSLTGKTIEEIEWDGRPSGLSSDGFLGEREKFKDRLKSDNTFVQAQGFTHQELAEPLLAVMNILDRIGDQRFDDFTYGGHHYRAEYESYRGFQKSLFNDSLQVDRDFTVTNLRTGKKLKFFFSPRPLLHCPVRILRRKDALSSGTRRHHRSLSASTQALAAFGRLGACGGPTERV